LLEVVSYVTYYMVVGIALGLVQRAAGSTEFSREASQHSG
jgi:hypothetical protein